LTAKGIISETFSVRSWIELTPDNRSVLDLYMEANISEAFTLRFGQLVMPGQAYDTSRRLSSTLLFVERPSITRKVSSLMGYNAFRDVGLMAYGTIGKLWYGFQISNGLGRIHQTGFTFFDRNFGSGLIGGRVDVEIIDGLELGSHISTNQQRNLIQNGSEPIDIKRTSWSIRASWDNLLVPGVFAQSEYISFNAADENWGITSAPGKTFNLSGFYTYAGYRLTQKWNILARYDRMTEHPGQSFNTSDFSTDQYSFGVSRFIHQNKHEIARFHLNYSFSNSGPMELKESILVLAMQLKFIP